MLPPVATESTQGRARAALVRWLTDRGSLLVGFSGGVDSAFLAVAALDTLGRDNVIAVLGVSDAVPAGIRARAQTLAAEFGVRFTETRTNELANDDYLANRGDRCYFCKRELWSRLVPIARLAGLATIADGTLLDDLGEHRPGHAAGREAGVESPLAECGFTKAMVRDAARARGIPIWDAPASPCLASRVATGVRVTPLRLRQVERAESALRAMGIVGDLRVRHLGDAARVELPPSVLPRWMDAGMRADIADAVRAAGFERVLIDERGYRRGALQEPNAPAVIEVLPGRAGTVSRDGP